MTDVLLTHSYHLYYDRKQTRKMQPYPPLGTLYAAGLLRRAGVSVAVFDTMLNDPEEGFREALKQHQPRIVVVFEDNFNFLSKMCLTRMREVAYRILEMSQQAGATVLAVGASGPGRGSSDGSRPRMASSSCCRPGLGSSPSSSEMVCRNS